VTALPVSEVLPALQVALRAPGAAVLCAPPGSGKTTAVPPALLEAPWLAERRIVMLEPRRVAARAAARYMASQLGEKVGERVGFSVRFESAVSARTRIEVVTEGVLTRRLQRDPALAGTGCVVFDEFHERSLEADLALALTLDARRGLREDLRVLVMSATLDAEPVAALLGGAPVVTAGARPYPVRVEHVERGTGAPSIAALCAAVRRALAESDGDVLAFLPGAGEIRRCTAQLADLAAVDVVVTPLYGELPAEAQDRAIRADPQGRRRVVLATNIAETSLTIEGVRAVVDGGLARRPRFDPNSGLTRLQTLPISRASAEQRAGRAARLGPGLALRLWSEADHARRAPHHPPEILEADLAGLALELARWGVASASDLPWLDAPPSGALDQARDLLAALGALDAAGRITAVGRSMAEIPAHPRLARMLVPADADGALAADLAAILDGPDPLASRDAGCDLAARVEALARYRRARGRAGAGESARALARAERVSAQLRARARVPDSTAPDPARAGAVLAAGYPDRVAQRRTGARGRFLMANGRGLRLDEHDHLAGCDYLVVPDLDAGAVEARAFRAAEISLQAIRTVAGSHIHDRRTVAWNDREQCVDARREECLGALVLEREDATDAEPDEIAAAMLAGVRRMGLGCLPWSDELDALRARVGSLAHWQPDAGWPGMDDATLEAELEEWLAPFLAGVTRREHLSRVDLRAALHARIPPQLASRLDEGAPTHLPVPSGSRIRLRYQPGEAPRLAVKLQEMFGCRRTPAVCWGQVPVVVELLSPARRPLHVTRDLEGFWSGAYTEVRKEMRGRYPRHPWPEDPLRAEPTRQAKPRRR
jgi:ATP-dependent helicase HrpB